MSITIATWNVNSVKSRLTHLCDWLREVSPDVVLLQEIKTIDENFPRMEIEDLGYNVETHGQKTYNGVAILSKHPIDDVTRGIPDFEDEQARYIEGVISLDEGAIRVASIYVPNGNEVGSEKFAYKMRFFDALKAHAKTLLSYEEMVVLGGDYNVAPTPEDVFDADKLDGTVCYHPDEREKLRTITNLGYYDAYRIQHPNSPQFSWWDYRGGSYPQNKGLRIDHLLLSPQAVDKLSGASVEESLRKLDKPSDHAPVMCTLAA